MLLFFVFKVVYNSEQVQGPFKVNQKQLFSSSGLETFISNPKKAIVLFTLTGPNVNVVYCTNRDSSPQDLSYFVHNSGSLSYCCKALQRRAVPPPPLPPRHAALSAAEKEQNQIQFWQRLSTSSNHFSRVKHFPICITQSK